MKLFKLILKWALGLFLLLVTAVVLLVIFKDTLLRLIIEHQIHAQTGMTAHIGRLETSFTTGGVRIQDLRLDNTAQFGGSAFLRIPELHLIYDPVSVSSGKLGFTLVRLDLAELNVVRNAAGQLNIDVKPLQEKINGGAAPGGQHQGSGNPKFEFGGIGTLDLTLGKVRYADLKTPANNYERDLGVQDEVFKNIKSEDDLYGVMLLLMARHGVNFGGGGGVGGILPLKF